MAFIPPVPTFQANRAIVDSRGLPTTDFLRALNSLSSVVKALLEIPELQQAIQDAQDAADNANNAAASVTGEQSLVNSAPANYTAPLLSADSAGNVPIANHDRVYGDPILNPTVAVVGDVLATAAVPGDIVRPYYLDPARAGGAVTYLFTINDDSAPVQGGDTHTLGAATIPAAGTQDGTPVRAPGNIQPIP